MLREAWEIMPLEKKISKAKHIGQLDRLCAAMAASDARLAEVSLAFEKDIKECSGGRHSAYAIAARLVWWIEASLRSNPSADWRAEAKAYTKDEQVLKVLAWHFA